MSNPWKESFEDLRSSIERVYEEQQNAEANIIKKARQLAYDIRYEVKKSFGKDGVVNSSAIKRAYLKKLSASPAPGPVKLKAKQMLVGVKEDFEFVNEEEKQLYKVTDAETKHTYTRKATRSKAEELRRNPKIASVEKSGAGEPYEGGSKKRWWDDDGDGKGYEPGEVSGSFKKKVKKESFSNWRDEMGENFFFNTLEEKVSPASPYCDVMPEQKGSDKQDDPEKSRQNKMLTRKEDFLPLAEELGGELVDVSENIIGAAAQAVKLATKLKAPVLKLGKDAPGAIVKYKPPGKLAAPKVTTPKLTKPKPKTKTTAIVKAKPKTKTTAIVKAEPKTKTTAIVKAEPKTKTIVKTKTKPKDLVKTQVGTLVKTEPKTGAIVSTKTKTKTQTQTPEPPPPTTTTSPGPKPQRPFKLDIPLPGLPKGPEQNINTVWAKTLFTKR